MKRTALTGVIIVLLASASPAAQQDRPAASLSAVSLETFEQWMRDLSNAGRWGSTDELGTLNLITPAKRKAAAAEVRDGVTVSLGREMASGENANAIQPLSLKFDVRTFDPIVSWGFDESTLLFHGWAYTHIDALSHTLYRGRMYNNYGREQLTDAGAQRLGIQVMQAGIVSRGVLIDVPRLKGRPYLELGTAITVADIEQWEREHRVRVEAGDVLLIRTGRDARAAAVGPWVLSQSAAGPHPSLAAWLKSRGVAVLGGDGSNEVYPPVVPGLSDPLHELALVALGMPLLDNLDLEAVAREAATRNRPTFLFVAAPLRTKGGSGSPLNPLATF